MTGDVVNLNKARKAKAKSDAKASAKTNRFKFGRGKAETIVEKLEAERAKRALDQRQLGRKPGEED